MATIVVAWVVEGLVSSGRPYAADLGARAPMQHVLEPKACVWLVHGNEADVERARAYITQEEPETGKVFVYEASERDPLGRARVDVLAERVGR